MREAYGKSVKELPRDPEIVELQGLLTLRALPQRQTAFITIS